MTERDIRPETVKKLADGNPLTYAEGESLQCSGASIAAVQDCLYYDRDKDRKILTLQCCMEEERGKRRHSVYGKFLRFL